MSARVPPQRVRRSTADAVLGGVCAGVARSAGLDPLLLRVVVVAVTVLTGGAGLPAYLLAWALIPAGTAPRGAVPPPRSPLDAAGPATVPGRRLRAPRGRAGTQRTGTQRTGAQRAGARGSGTQPAGTDTTTAVTARVDEVTRRLRGGRT